MLPDAKAGEQHFLEAIAFVGREGAAVDLDTLPALLENQRLRLARAGKE